MKPTDSIAIVGAGAVGLYYGGRLAQAGHPVHFFTRTDAAAIRAKGVRVDSVNGNFALAAGETRVYDDVAAMPKVDLVISTLKATARPSYRELIAPLLNDATPIVALQNGLGNEEALAHHFGADRVLGAIAYVCIHRIAPGHVRHTSHGELKVGEFGRPTSPRLTAIVDAMRRAKVQALAVDDLRRHRWDKLVWNVPFNGLGAADDQNCAQLLATADGKAKLRAVMAEVIRAAAAVGIAFPPTTIDLQISRSTAVGPYQTSMQLDRRAGRAMEIDAILGEVIRQGEAAGSGELTTLRALEARLVAIDASRVSA